MLVGAGAAVAAIGAAVALVPVLAGPDQEPERIRTAAEARDVAKRVALTPADWGSGYVRSDPYETDDVTHYVADDSCYIVAQRPATMLAGLQRSVQKSDQSVGATSGVIVHRDAASATTDIARMRADAARCPTELDSASKQKWENVRALDLPDLKGSDEVAGEEGHLVVDHTGLKADTYYTQLTARKGQVLMQATVVRTANQGHNREDAVNALSVMLSRL
ncbi:hypothetical protein [Streptomyces sp. NPDC047706]|uniref:hypothetical protein n=1 Tax=Streptomyces sp. NPDC047706 TaxID=3365486 RepID=UPI00371347D0